MAQRYKTTSDTSEKLTDQRRNKPLKSRRELKSEQMKKLTNSTISQIMDPSQVIRTSQVILHWLDLLASQQTVYIRCAATKLWINCKKKSLKAKNKFSDSFVSSSHANSESMWRYTLVLCDEDWSMWSAEFKINIKWIYSSLSRSFCAEVYLEVFKSFM